jgi:hypothetical protein
MMPNLSLAPLRRGIFFYAREWSIDLKEYPNELVPRPIKSAQAASANGIKSRIFLRRRAASDAAAGCAATVTKDVISSETAELTETTKLCSGGDVRFERMIKSYRNHVKFR